MNKIQNIKQQTRIDKNYALLRIISFLFISILIAVFTMYIYDFHYNYNTVMFIMLIPLMILSFFVFSDSMHPFNIFFITSQFLFVFNMVDVNANKSNFRYGSLPADYHDTAFFWAILVIAIWYTFMYFGYLVSKRSKTKPITNSIFQINNTNIISVILLIIGILSYLYMMSLKGGFAGIIEALSGRVEAYSGLSYFIRLTGLLTISALMLLSNGYKKLSMFLIFISFLMLASFGGRGTAFFGSLFPYLIFFHYQIKSIRIIKLIPLGIITILFAIGLGNYRLYQELRINITGFFDLISDIASGTAGGEILPSLVGSLIKSDIDYQYGSTLMNIIYAPIPSSIWSNKPNIDESGIVGKALMGGDYWGLPPGPYGISFFNFGFIGVIIVAFIVGILVYKLYYKFILSNTNKKIVKIFYVLIISSVFNFISTSEQIYLLWYIGVFVVIKLIDILISSIKYNRKQMNINSKAEYNF